MDAGPYASGKFNVGSAGSWVLYEGAFFVVQWIVIGVALALVYQWTGRRAGAEAMQG